MSQPATLRSRLDRLQRTALLAGAAGLVLCGVGAFLNPAQFFRSYLLAYLFWLGLALGCLAILMVHYLAGGTWGSDSPARSGIGDAHTAAHGAAFCPAPVWPARAL